MVFCESDFIHLLLNRYSFQPVWNYSHIRHINLAFVRCFWNHHNLNIYSATCWTLGPLLIVNSFLLGSTFSEHEIRLIRLGTKRFILDCLQYFKIPSMGSSLNKDV